MKPRRGLLIAAVLVTLTISTLLPVHKEDTTAISDTSEDAGGITWSHLSSAYGDLPLPTVSTQQTSALILDVNNDRRNAFVIGARRSPGPSLTWYKRLDERWERYVIDDSILPIEAGGAFSDIDSDGDLDVLMGADAAGDVYWIDDVQLVEISSSSSSAVSQFFSSIWARLQSVWAAASRR